MPAAGSIASLAKATVGTVKITKEVAEISYHAIRKPQLIKELANNNINHTAADILGIRKLSDGKSVFLAKGNPASGLEHIVVGKANNFLDNGTTVTEIPALIMNSLTKGKVVGTSSGAPVYQFIKNGETKNTTIVVGSNGYIVTSYPVTTWKPLP